MRGRPTGRRAQSGRCTSRSTARRWGASSSILATGHSSAVTTPCANQPSGGADAPSASRTSSAVWFPAGDPFPDPTRDGDPIQGDSNYDLVLSDWRDVGGVKIAHAQTYQLNGVDLVVSSYEQITPNPALGSELFEIHW